MPDRTIAYAQARSAPGPRGIGTLFRRRFMAGDRATRAVLAELVHELMDAGIGDEDISNVELILAEVLNNVAEHAYVEASGPVDLRIEVQIAGIACRVADQGRPLPSGVVPDPALPMIAPPDHLPEGGFGWHIIRALTDDIGYARDGDWNCLTMRLPWAD